MFSRVRRQLTAWYVGVLAAIVLIFGGLLYVQLSRAIWLEQDVRLIAYIAAGQGAGHYEGDLHPGPAALPGGPGDEREREGPGDALPAGAAVWLIGAGGSASLVSGDARVTPDDAGLYLARQAGAGAGHTLRRGAAWYRSYSMPVRADESAALVQALAPADEAHDLLQRTLWLIVLVGGGAVLLAGVAGLFLANRALVPIKASWQRQRDFASDASHELRTPLAIVHAAAQVLQQRLPPGSPEAETLGDLLAASERMRALVDDLLLLARADSGRLELTLAPVDLAEVVRESVEPLRLLAAQRGLDLSCAAAGPAWVSGDRRRLGQVVTILVDNAIRHHRPGGGGWVRVNLGAARGRVSLSVADNGPGIPPGDLPRIFDRFYRGDRCGGEGGTGLGLAIARELVTAHGGSIRVQSTPGAGTLFTVELPGSAPR